VIVLYPNAINDVAVSWLPRWVEGVDTRTSEQDGSFDAVVTRGLLDFVERISHLTWPTIRSLRRGRDSHSPGQSDTAQPWSAALG
jgi:hypothetical protein